jgi:hypothetical protein
VKFKASQVGISLWKPISPFGERAVSSETNTPYWTTFELPLIEMKAASVGILEQAIAGLR